jgi:hypothetical protein
MKVYNNIKVNFRNVFEFDVKKHIYNQAEKRLVKNYTYDDSESIWVLTTNDFIWTHIRQNSQFITAITDELLDQITHEKTIIAVTIKSVDYTDDYLFFQIDRGLNDLISIDQYLNETYNFFDNDGGLKIIKVDIFSLHWQKCDILNINYSLLYTPFNVDYYNSELYEQLSPQGDITDVARVNYINNIRRNAMDNCILPTTFIANIIEEDSVIDIEQRISYVEIKATFLDTEESHYESINTQYDLYNVMLFEFYIHQKLLSTNRNYVLDYIKISHEL